MVRENLVLAAISFLKSPTVQKHHDETKRKFLLEKGLKLDEILAAFARSRNAKPLEKQEKDFNIVMDECLQEKGHITNKSTPTRPPVPLLVVAAISSAAIGIVMYLYKLLRRHLWPWIAHHWKGAPVRIENMHTSNVEMSDITASQMYEMQDTICSIKSELDKQQMQIMELCSKNPSAVDEMKKEIASIRKMLLSKDSFPSPNPSNIPSWQIRKYDDNGNLPETTNVSTNTSIKTVESFDEIALPDNNPDVILYRTEHLDSDSGSNHDENKIPSENDSEPGDSFDSYSQDMMNV